jgi:hypothetical protein
VKQVKTLEFQVAMAMNETDRLPYLLLLADESTAAAEELIRLAPKFPSDPHYGDAIFQSNLTLGRQALKQGDVKGAVRFMKAAGNAPALSEGLRQLMLGPDNLANALLQAGERESVAAFLEQSATLLPLRRDQLSKAAASIRAGMMPMS